MKKYRFLLACFLMSIFASCGTPTEKFTPSIHIQSELQRIVKGQPYPFAVSIQAKDGDLLHVTVLQDGTNQPILDKEQAVGPQDTAPRFTAIPMTDGLYLIHAELQSDGATYKDTFRFGAVVQEGGPADLLLFQYVSSTDLATKLCQSTEEFLIDIPTPSGMSLLLHLFPDPSQNTVPGFRAFYGEVKNDPTQGVFATCANDNLFLKIKDPNDPIYLESMQGVGAKPNEYLYYRQSWLDSAYVQKSIQSAMQTSAHAKPPKVFTLTPQCKSLNFAVYLGFGVSEAEARATWMASMDILQKKLHFYDSVTSFVPIALNSESTSLDQIGKEFCDTNVPKSDTPNITGRHLFTNPSPKDSDSNCTNNTGAEYVNGAIPCGVTLMRRSTILCRLGDWISGISKALITAHEVGHSFGIGHDCSKTADGECTLMYSGAKDQYGKSCTGTCLDHQEVLSEASIQQAMDTNNCGIGSVPKSCLQHCVQPFGICDKGSGNCLCSIGFEGEACDRCSPGFVGYPNCRLWVAPSCFDETKNGTETDQDCGGGCTKCINGKMCKGAPDCQSGVCSLGICQKAKSTWRFVPSGVTEDLLDVWGSGPTDIWAVGFSGRLLHYDGRNWSVVPSGTTSNLYAIWGANKNDVWFAGNANIFRKNGNSFAAETVPPVSPGIFGLFGTGPNDVWAVGIGGLGVDTILHRTGGPWSNAFMGYPIVSQKGWAASSSDAWSVGYHEMTLAPVLLRWNGMSWGIFGGGLPVNATNAFFSIWGASGNDVWVGDGAGGLLHWDGSSWSFRSIGITIPIFGIWGSSGNDIWAVGGSGLGKGLILHYTGGNWTIVHVGTSSYNLRGIWGSGPDNIWAVGSGGTILHYSP